MFSAPLASDSKFYLYHISNIHRGLDMSLGSLLHRIFNLLTLVPRTHSLNYHSFILNLDIQLEEQLLQNSLGFFDPSLSHINVRIRLFSSRENSIDMLHETILTIDINLGVTAIFTILGFPKYKYEMYLYVFTLIQVSFEIFQ